MYTLKLDAHKSGQPFYFARKRVLPTKNIVRAKPYNDDSLTQQHNVSRLNSIYYQNYVDVQSLRDWMEDKWGESYDIEFYKHNASTWVFEVKTAYLGQTDFRFETCEAYENYLTDVCASLNDLGLAKALEHEIKRCTHAPYIVLGRWKQNVKIPLKSSEPIST